LKRRPLLIALLVTLLLGVASPAAASAQPWTTRLACATGEFTDQWTAVDDLGRSATWLGGWIEPCGTPDANERFGLIYYVQDLGESAPRAYVFEDRLRALGPGRTHFEGAIDASVEQTVGAIIGICVAHAADRPVACYTDPQRGEDEPDLPPIEDLRHLKSGPHSTEPNCGNCV